jgi:hypothetical protein
VAGLIAAEECNSGAMDGRTHELNKPHVRHHIVYTAPITPKKECYCFGDLVGHGEAITSENRGRKHSYMFISTLKILGYSPSSVVTSLPEWNSIAYIPKESQFYVQSLGGFRKRL